MLHNNHLFSFYYLGQLLIQPVLTEYQIFYGATGIRTPQPQGPNFEYDKKQRVRTSVSFYTKICPSHNARVHEK